MRKIHYVTVLMLILAGCGGGITAYEEIADNDYDTIVLDGWKEYNNNLFEEAQSLFAEALEIDANRAEGYIGVGWSLFMRQKPDSALVLFTHGFDQVTTSNDSLDTICGISGCHLARGDNDKAINYLDQFDLDAFEGVFPLEDHDFFLDRGNLELIYTQAYYRLGIYSNAESPDPNNAVYHLNQAISAPYTYQNPEGLMDRMIEFLN